MSFASLNFFIFFPIVFLLYAIMPKKWRYIWLTLASYYFYMSWNAYYTLLILLSTTTTYFCALKIENKNSQRDFYIILCILINLGMLALFKYSSWILASVRSVFGPQSISPDLKILLPVGISFYTFQAIGYIVDVYRGEVKSEKNFLKYALFVSFFPQLVAGPIERSKNLLKQIQRLPRINIWNYQNISSGLILMVWGFFLKLVIADRAAVFVNTVYDEYYFYNSVALTLATVLFSLQIYCDFMGYTTIAIGAARVLGFKLMENFNTPYFAMDIREFWQRWHISLSSWFKDYVYIPLGGNRCSSKRRHINVFITFLISGLWHGAGWNYVIWGALHGLYLIFGSITYPLRQKMHHIFQTKTEAVTYKMGKIMGTYILVCFAWIFFRAPDLTAADNIIKRIFTRIDAWSLFDGSLYEQGLDVFEFNILLAATGMLFLVSLIKYHQKKNIDAFLQKEGVVFRGIFLIFLITITVIFGEYGDGNKVKDFVYFQF